MMPKGYPRYRVFCPTLTLIKHSYHLYGMHMVIKSLAVIHSKVMVLFVFVAHWGGTQGFKGSGENGYLFSGSWGVLVIIFRDGGNKFIVFGDFRSPAKKRLKNLTLKEKAFISFDFSKKIFGFSKETPLGKSKCINFRPNMRI